LFPFSRRKNFIDGFCIEADLSNIEILSDAAYDKLNAGSMTDELVKWDRKRNILLWRGIL